MRAHKPTGADMLLEGWLPPRSAAAALGITEQQLRGRAERGEIRRRPIIHGSRIYLYEVLR